ncbi:hypothetical protein BST81_24195 [Leptolyngbya sp. 'hensonii']|uniref:PAM68 family protein n=1 Tax=Leptolyngbya sp. 'hensonii' TaxID=1922337 RepID=UPI00094FA108|nr:PAM68 family protein [Leptolyngbya sp. 'hensonii']OLP15827.1 hypothetical protein BST81_24195 [Leptolyngbya sp. 'hensonii']
MAARDPLPFEPAKNSKKTTPESAAKDSSGPEVRQQGATSAAASGSTRINQAQKKQSGRVGNSLNQESEATSIPQAVSRRMVRRMAVFSGIPTTLGVAVFFISYWIVIQGWFKLPNAIVVFLSMGCFGLGVLGLSYGVLSASWDEETTGGWLGWPEFTTNLGRMTAAWRSARQKD